MVDISSSISNYSFFDKLEGRADLLFLYERGIEYLEREEYDLVVQDALEMREHYIHPDYHIHEVDKRIFDLVVGLFEKSYSHMKELVPLLEEHFDIEFSPIFLKISDKRHLWSCLLTTHYRLEGLSLDEGIALIPEIDDVHARISAYLKLAELFPAHAKEILKYTLGLIQRLESGQDQLIAILNIALWFVKVGCFEEEESILSVLVQHKIIETEDDKLYFCLKKEVFEVHKLGMRGETLAVVKLSEVEKRASSIQSDEYRADVEKVCIEARKKYEALVKEVDSQDKNLYFLLSTKIIEMNTYAVNGEREVFMEKLQEVERSVHSIQYGMRREYILSACNNLRQRYKSLIYCGSVF